jgi:hypothetical protein
LQQFSFSSTSLLLSISDFDSIASSSFFFLLIPAVKEEEDEEDTETALAVVSSRASGPRPQKTPTGEKSVHVSHVTILLNNSSFYVKMYLYSETVFSEKNISSTKEFLHFSFLSTVSHKNIFTYI